MCTKEEAEKNLRIIENAINGLEYVKLDAKSLYIVMESYAKDARNFYLQAKYNESVECAYIVWAYIDAMLHLGKIKINEKVLSYFTV
jgi:hypothetical protein